VSRETTFKIPLDIPTTPKAKIYFRTYLKQLGEQLDTKHPFGEHGEHVGIGFVWETHTALANGGLNLLSRRMQRALRSSGIMSAIAEPYYLLQRINYIRFGEGEPNVTFKLQEDDD
jgi:hypothetical protein